HDGCAVLKVERENFPRTAVAIVFGLVQAEEFGVRVNLHHKTPKETRAQNSPALKAGAVFHGRKRGPAPRVPGSTGKARGGTFKGIREFFARDPHDGDMSHAPELQSIRLTGAQHGDGIATIEHEGLNLAAVQARRHHEVSASEF